MVVVAIVGVLSSIATAQYEKFSMRARQSEAKIALAAIYSAEQAYFVENGTFTSCLAQIGFSPTAMGGTASKRYYSTGFNNDDANDPECGNPGTERCDHYQWGPDGLGVLPRCIEGTDTFFPAVFRANTALDLAAEDDLDSDVKRSTFSIQAVGVVSSSCTTSYDIWTITHVKLLRNVACQ